MDKTSSPATPSLAEQLNRLDAAMLAFYEQDFADDDAERERNQGLKQALLALAAAALRQGQPTLTEQALQIVAENTGCQEDMEILAAVMDSSDGLLLAAFPPTQAILASAATARWDAAPEARPPLSSSRRSQLYAASCLRCFCQAKALSHPAITQLLAHLYAIEHAASLPEWASRGVALDLNGRGDPPPPDLARRLDAQGLLHAFLELVDCVVEVGLADLYGADTALPATFIRRVEAILQTHAVSLPAA